MCVREVGEGVEEAGEVEEALHSGLCSGARSVCGPIALLGMLKRCQAFHLNVIKGL